MQYECFQGSRAGVFELRVTCTLANVRERSCAVERPFIIVFIHLWSLPRKSGLLKTLRVVSLWLNFVSRHYRGTGKLAQRIASVRSINSAIYIQLRKQAAHRSGSH